MVDIADVPFSAVPEDEQTQFVAKPREFGEPKGYKQRKAWVSRVFVPFVCVVSTRGIEC